MKILSIDFDYFVDTDIDTRNELFPNGLDEAPKELCDQLWSEAYNNPELLNITVNEDYHHLCNYLKSCNYTKGLNVLIADSHKNIKRVIDLIPSDKDIEVVNIDFHHDFYHYFSSGDNYNCGNWVRRLLEDRPNTKVTWVRREDSQIESLEGEVPFYHTTNIHEVLEHKDFDYVFICESPEWTPPHLHQFYKEMIEYNIL